MNLTFSNNKLQSTLCILLSALPISLLSGSLIINLLTILILITFLLEILIKKRLDFLNDWSFYLLLFLWASFIINLFFSQDKSLSFFRTIGFVRFIFLAQAIRYVFLLNDNNYKIFILRIWAIIFIIVSFDLLLEYFNGINILGYKSNLEGRLASFLGEELKIGGYYFGFALIFLATINAFLKGDFKVFQRSFTIYRVNTQGITSRYKKYGKSWWMKRHEAFNYMLYISKKLNLKFKRGPDFYLTKLVNFFF